MDKPIAEQLYCSVDLEFTGFDPSRDQILEIGFAFFKLTENGFEVVEEWSQVFKPTMEVHPKILGLTGITQEELDSAPEFSEHREFLQAKLGDAIIVGHNPVMDVKFLESYGIKLSGKTIDTLELVQFILPTHHSYNLENLVHYFGVQHHKAHRALGDALSTILVLENLVHVYQNFSEKLRKELNTVLDKEEFTWRALLDFNLNKKILQSNDSLTNHSAENLTPFVLTDHQINIDTAAYDHEARVALGLANENKSSLIVVPDSATAMQLWQRGLAHGIFRTEDTFSKKAFHKFLKAASSRDELRFCLKVLVWLETNWQTEVVFDLNISFFGGQYRQFIIGGATAASEEKLIVSDYVTLQTLVQSHQFDDRQLIVCDILNFEKFISSGFGTKLTWNNVLYSLRLIYNPETEFGNQKLKQQVISALAATDLFFGLVYILLHQNLPDKQYATLEDLKKSHEHIFNRLEQAAQNLSDKISAVANELSGAELSKTIKYLANFFTIIPGRVKWIFIDEFNSSFYDQPIDISESTNEIIKSFVVVKFTDTVTNASILSYIVDRLGLHTEIPEIVNKSLSENLEIQISTESFEEDELFKLSINSPLPLVVIMKQPTNIKEFYNEHYLQIKENAALFAQGYSGGGNKMFRNFSIKENSVLLVTADFMSKQNYSISAKNLLFFGLPPVEIEHPYIAALLKHWHTKHNDLLAVFAVIKIVSAMKKIKLNRKVIAKIFTLGKNFPFWG